MRRIHPGDYVSDDELAMQNVRKLMEECRCTYGMAYKVSKKCNVASSTMVMLKIAPERCTVRTYNLLRKAYGWSEYIPGRKLDTSSCRKEQECSAAYSCNAMEFMSEDDDSDLELIAEFYSESVEEIIARAVKQYIARAQNIIDFMKYRKSGH